MNLSLDLQTIMSMVKGRSFLDHSFFVHCLASLESATEHDLAVVFEPEDGSPFPPLEKTLIEKTKAGLLLAKTEVVPGKQYLLVDDPLLAYSQLVQAAERNCFKTATVPVLQGSFFIAANTTIGLDVGIGAGVVIESGVSIGAGSLIGSGAYLGKQVTIGRGVLISPGVKILDRCTVGDGSIIHSGAVIGSDGFGYRISKQGLRKIPHIGTVSIGRMVELGANVTIDRAVFDQTVIEDAVKIDNGVHIAHGVIVGAGTAILAQTGIAGSVKIGKGCQIGGQVAIKDHLVIGDGVKIVSKSAVMKNLKAGEVVCGIPAMPFFEWKRVSVAVTKLPELLKKAADILPIVESYQKKKSWFGWFTRDKQSRKEL